MSKSAELRTTEKTVKFILETIPYTRNSDDWLVVEVYRYINPTIITLPFGVVMKNIKEWKLPSFKSIYRARRKVQGEYPELRAISDVEAGRMLAEEEFKRYARTQITS